MSLRPADLHIHSTFSDGKTELVDIAAIARAREMEIGIADHCGPGTFQLDSDPRFERYFAAVSQYNVYRSVELDLGREIGVSLRNLKRCDYLIGGVHSLAGRDFFDPSLAWTDVPALLDGMLAAIDEKARIFGFDILAHPGLLPVNLRSRAADLLDARWDERLIELARRRGFALEISSRWKLPLAPTIKRAKAAGVKFSFGSDAHHPEQVCRLDFSLGLAAQGGLGDGDLFRPARQLAEKMA
ncbi:MAG TPA: PHP domain-containing protein [Candidatus Edwardsbacteria bacterium]|nr:PHP domain-containing protein [Candidatus Edwardsbacteria bacterium]